MFDLSKDLRGFWALTVSGRMDEAEMKACIEAYLAALDSDPKAPFLYTLTDFEFPSLQAIAVEFGYLPHLFASLSKIGPTALIADEAWLRTAGELEGRVIPGLTIKAFRPDEEDAAVAWLMEDAGRS